MTTQTWAAVIDHTSDAGFRAWVADFIARLAAVGLVQTSDTGQINTATVNRPGTNTEGGYAIFRFNDTQQSAAPIFIRFGFGTDSGATLPRITIIVGTSTNGAGTIGGVVSGAARALNQTVAVVSTVTNYTSHMCAVDGCFWFGWKKDSGSADRYRAGAMICRTTDGDGVPDDEGCVIYGNSTTIAVMTYQVLRFTDSVVGSVGSSTRYAFVPWSVTSSLISPGGDTQAFTHFFPFPKMRPLFGCCTYVAAEVTAFTTFSVDLIGGVSHTYLAVTAQGFGYGDSTASTNYGLAFVFE